MKRAGDHDPTGTLLFAGQVKLLYDKALLAYVVTVINGAIMVIVLSRHTGSYELSLWYGAVLAVTAARATMAWMYRRAPEPDPLSWRNAYVVGAFLAGTAWGSAAILIFPESSPHQIFIAFILAGMAAGSVTVLAPRMEACLAFLLPELLPLSIRYLTQPTELQTAMGILTLVFLGGMTVSAWKSYLVVRKTLALSLDKQQLKGEIEERYRFEEQLFQERDRLKTTLSSIGEGVVLIDADGRVEYLNPAAEQLSGWSFHRALHRPVGEVLQSVNRKHQPISTAVEDSLRRAAPIRKQIVLCCKAGSTHIIDELATPLYDRHGKQIGAVSVLRDTTEAQEKLDALVFAANHDPLTGLPNRNLLTELIHHAIARAQRKHDNFALLFLDLDRFKEVNDTRGHAAGDVLLCEVTARLKRCVREEDTIARLGGDEFVVLLEVTSDERVGTVANKILCALRQPYQFGAETVCISVSIGVSTYPSDGRETESLLKHADTAMYRSKRLGRDRISM